MSKFDTTSSRTERRLWPFGLGFSALVPAILTLLLLLLLYHIGLFGPAPIQPNHEWTRQRVTGRSQDARTLQDSDLIGYGLLLGPEDIAHDPKSQLIYTGCADGWIKQVKLNETAPDSVVRNWVNTGGRPMGLVLGHHNEIIVTDPHKGLLKVHGDGKVKHLTSEAEGLQFKLLDGVDLAKNGTIYFTDASYKYSLNDYLLDFLEGKPHGRFMSYDPSTGHTKVLVRDLYFANGVAVSPDQNFVIFCETTKKRCRKYFIQGKRLGEVDKFIENLPGWPDVIRYDGEGHFWIAMAKPITTKWDLALRCPFVRKILAINMRYFEQAHMMEEDGGIMAVDLEGKPVAYYHNFELSLVSSGLKINNHVYCGSYYNPYIIRINLANQFPPHDVNKSTLNHEAFAST